VLAVPDVAGLSANPVKNARALLRNALPVANKPVRQVQKHLEDISENLRVPGVDFRGVQKNVNAAIRTLEKGKAVIVKDVALENKEEVQQVLNKLQTELLELKRIAENEDRQALPGKQQQVLEYVGQIEEAMIGSFPFEVPTEFQSLPRLEGRATVEIDLTFTQNPNYEKGKMLLMIDGYNAPISSGNFADLVVSGFYDGMEWQRADGFVVQTGQPSDGSVGYKPTGLSAIRNIPLEIMVQGDSVPSYGETLEDMGRYREEPVLPFNAFGTVAWARNEFDNNSASSQFFVLLKESELTPSGTNILDGRYGVFGYIIEGQDFLREIKVGDKISKMKLISGGEHLINNKSGAQSEGQSQTITDADV